MKNRSKFLKMTRLDSAIFRTILATIIFTISFSSCHKNRILEEKSRAEASQLKTAKIENAKNIERQEKGITN